MMYRRQIVSLCFVHSASECCAPVFLVRELMIAVTTMGLRWRMNACLSENSERNLSGCRMKIGSYRAWAVRSDESAGAETKRLRLAQSTI